MEQIEKEVVDDAEVLKVDDASQSEDAFEIFCPQCGTKVKGTEVKKASLGTTIASSAIGLLGGGIVGAIAMGAVGASFVKKKYYRFTCPNCHTVWEMKR